MAHVKFKEIEVGEVFLHRGTELVKSELSREKSSFAVVRANHKDVNILGHMRTMQKKSNSFTIRKSKSDETRFAFFEDEVTVIRKNKIDRN